MAWLDDPANVLAYNQIVDPATWNGWAWAGGQFWYIGGTTATAPAAAEPTPVVTPPHLQFSNQTLGATTMLAYGRCRLPGQLIWAAGIDASTSELDTSYLSFATAYCEPIDPEEPLRIQKMWANGTLFYDYDSGGVINVANIPATDQEALQTCIDAMETHWGGPGELPSPIMEDFLGAGNVPAHRGLRTLVFQDFPLSVANNSVPNINVEFRRTDTTLIAVSDAIAALVSRYQERLGMQGVDTSLPGYVPVEIDGVDDECYGLVISDQSTLLDKLGQYSGIYKYQLIDGQPIKLQKRAVDSGLVIDYTLDESDLIRRNGAAAVSFQRLNPLDLPAGLDLRYPDFDNEYDISTAVARHEGSGVSNAIASLSSDFIMDAATARELAFEVMYKGRTEGMRLTFEMDDLTVEVGDIIEITTTRGDIFVCLVQQQTQTKTRSSTIQALNLLTVAGSDINGDNYRDGGGGRRYWPEETNDWALAVNSTRIWGIIGYTPCYNYTAGPRRRISTFLDNLSDLDVGGTDWSWVGPPGQILLDDNYAYYISDQSAVITRVPINGSFSQRETLVIADGFWHPSGFGYVGASGATGINTGAGGIYNAVIYSGKMYIPWAGKWGGATTQMKLVVVDLGLWSPTGYAVYDYSTDTTLKPGAWGLCVTDNGTIVISCQISGGVPAGRIYYNHVSTLAGSPNNWSYIDLTYSPGFGVSSGDYAYFLETIETTGTTGRKTHLIIVNCNSLALSVSYVDMSGDDPNFQWISQASQNITVFPWVSDSHLFLNANYTRNLTGANAHAGEHPYIAKRELVTGASAGGVFFRDVLPWTWELFVDTNTYFDGNHYLQMYSQGSSGSIVTMDEALTAATLYPRATSSVPPGNGTFAGATLLAVGDTATNQNLYYATYEDGEDYGPHGAYPTGWDSTHESLYAPEHGVWYRHHATATATRTVTISGNAVQYMNIWIVTGSSVTSLSDVASKLAPFSGSLTTLSWSATSGTDYYIRISMADFLWAEPEVDKTHRFSISIT